VALTSGFHLAFWIGAGLVAGAIAVTTLVVRSRPALAEADAIEARGPELEGRARLLGSGVSQGPFRQEACP